MSDPQSIDPVQGSRLLDRSRAAALRELAQEAIQAVLSVHEFLAAETQREETILAEWQRYLETGQKTWKRGGRRKKAPQEGSPYAKTDWKPFRPAFPDWRRKCMELAGNLDLAGFVEESEAIRREASNPERVASGEELGFFYRAERGRVDRLLGILRPLAEDLERTVATPGRPMIERLGGMSAEAKLEAGRQGGVKHEGFLVSELKKMTGLGNTALGNYARKAGVQTPGRGQKNHRYTANEARAILTQIEKDSTEQRLKVKCQEALRTLSEITS